MSEVDPRTVWLRGKLIVFSHADSLAYADLLTKAFPSVRFIDHPYFLPKGKEPQAATVGSLTECHCENVQIVFDPAWRPAWGCDEGPRSNRWWMKGLPYPNATFERGRGVQQLEKYSAAFGGEVPEVIGSSRIYFRLAPGDKDHLAVARKALRLVAKVASNKNLFQVKFPSMEVTSPRTDSEWWVGNDARRWCLEKPSRILAWDMRPVPP